MHETSVNGGYLLSQKFVIKVLIMWKTTLFVAGRGLKDRILKPLTSYAPHHKMM